MKSLGIGLGCVVVKQAQAGLRRSATSKKDRREGVDMKFGFLAKHRAIRLVAWLCAARGPLPELLGQ
jgi:hypothetical protein